MPKPVLSNYPVSQDNMGSDAVPRICNASWMDSGLYRMDAAHDTWPKCAHALYCMSASSSGGGPRNPMMSDNAVSTGIFPEWIQAQRLREDELAQSSARHQSSHEPTQFWTVFCRGMFVKVPFAAAGFLFCVGSMLQVIMA